MGNVNILYMALQLLSIYKLLAFLSIFATHIIHFEMHFENI